MDKGTRVQMTVLLPAMFFLYLRLTTWRWPQGTGLRIKWTLPLSYTASPRSHFLFLFFLFAHYSPSCGLAILSLQSNLEQNIARGMGRQRWG